MLAAFGGGNLIGTVLAARVADRWLSRTCCLAWTGAGLGFIGLAAAPTYLLFLTVAAGIGVCTPLANVTVNAAIAAIAATVLGLPLAAALTSDHGPATALSSAGALIVGAALLVLIATARTQIARSSSQSRNTNTNDTRSPCWGRFKLAYRWLFGTLRIGMSAGAWDSWRRGHPGRVRRSGLDGVRCRGADSFWTRCRSG